MEKVEFNKLPKSKFYSKLSKLFSNYPDINISKMGFPKNWENDNFWS